MGTDAARLSIKESALWSGARWDGDVSREKFAAASHCPPPAACTRPPSNGPPVPDEYLYKVVDALDQVAKETEKSVRPGRAELAAAAAHRLDRHHRRAKRRAVTSEPCARQDGRSRRRRSRPSIGPASKADLPVLAPMAVRRTQSAAGASREIEDGGRAPTRLCRQFRPRISRINTDKPELFLRI